MAWTVKQRQDSRFSCVNENQDTTDESWATEAEAIAWAAEANAAFAAHLAAQRAKAAARAAKRAALEASLPTDILTSRGDGWEGNG